MVGRKHDAERRERHVERAIRVRQRFGIGYLEPHVEAFGASARGAFVQQLGDVVGGGYVSESVRRGQGRIAVAGRDVEHALAGAHVDCFDQRFADDLQGGADHREVAAGPCGLLLRLDDREIRCRVGLDGLSDGGHVSLLKSSVVGTARIVRSRPSTGLARGSERFAHSSAVVFSGHRPDVASATMRASTRHGGPMSQDTLSDVLRSVRLRTAVFYFVSCEGDWVAEAPASKQIADAVMPDAEHVIEYHVVTSGECWAAIVGEQPRKLKRGDIILLPQGDAHVVSSAPGMRARQDVDSYFEMQRNQRPFRVHYANGATPVSVHRSNDGPALSASDAGTTLVCGFIGVDVRPFNPLLATLPRLLHLSGAGGRSEQFAHLAAEE